MRSSNVSTEPSELDLERGKWRQRNGIAPTTPSLWQDSFPRSEGGKRLSTEWWELQLHK
jgi:hypothetical protein